MKIKTLALRPFRNFHDTELSLMADKIFITGPNGRGKTNVLEAIAYLSIGRSVRFARDRECIPHGRDFFDIRAMCHTGHAEKCLRVFFGCNQGKLASVNGNVLPRIVHFVGIFRTVFMASEAVSMVLRSPAQRRRLIDIVIAQQSCEYIDYLQRYQRVLAQRNAILRSNTHSGSGNTLDAWTEQLAVYGSWIRKTRIEKLTALRDSFLQYVMFLGGAGEKIDVKYKGSAPEGKSQVQHFIDQLHEKRQREIHAGHTLVGPHRDDLVFTLNGESAPLFASEGQLKTIIIAWKMAEVTFLETPVEGKPVLLMDDILKDLDQNRTSAFMELVNEFEQVIFTSPIPLPGYWSGKLQKIDLHE